VRWADSFAGVLAPQTDVHLTIDVGTLVGCPEHADELVDRRLVCRSVFEPGKKVEGLTKIVAVMEPPGDARQVGKAAPTWWERSSKIARDQAARGDPTSTDSRSNDLTTAAGPGCQQLGFESTAAHHPNDSRGLAQIR